MRTVGVWCARDLTATEPRKYPSAPLTKSDKAVASFRPEGEALRRRTTFRSRLTVTVSLGLALPPADVRRTRPTPYLF
jgi:hypothetical protein